MPVIRSGLQRSDLPYADVREFIRPGMSVAEQTAAMQYLLDTYLDIVFGRGVAVTINDTLALRDNHRLFVDRGSITQTGTNKALFNFNGKTGIVSEGGNFFGVGTDFINASTLKYGFYGVTSGSISVCDGVFTNFADAAIGAVGATHVRVLRNRVVGPGSAVLTAVTSGTCVGVSIDQGCSDVIVDDNVISDVAQGVTLGDHVTGAKLINNQISGVIGQHGIYAGGGLADIMISGNSIDNVSLCGIKVQSYDAVTAVSKNIQISNNPTIANCGAHGILALNIDTPATFPMENVVVSQNIISACVENGIFLGNSVLAKASGNIIRNVLKNGILIEGLSKSEISDNFIFSAANNGIKESTACTSSKIARNSIVDCCSANLTAEEHGIYIAGGSSLSIEDNVVSDANGNMRYGLYLGSPNQSSMIVRKNIVTGATDYGARFYDATIVMTEYSGNLFSGASGDALFAPPANFGAQSVKRNETYIVPASTGADVTVGTLTVAVQAGARVRVRGDVGAGFWGYALLTAPDSSDITVAGMTNVTSWPTSTLGGLGRYTATQMAGDDFAELLILQSGTLQITMQTATSGLQYKTCNVEVRAH